MIVQANVDADEKMEKLKKEKTELCDTINTIREYFSDEESKKYRRGRGIDSSTWRHFLDNLKSVSVEIKSILDRVQKEKLQEENTKLRDVLDEIDTRTEQLSVDLDWTNCGFRKQCWDEFKEDISKQKSTLNTVIENTVEADEFKKYKEENKKLCQALEKILYWQKKLDERMKFNNSTEGRERESKWRAFHDHMCTLIETNTAS
jgi:paraquat-inducible protein B